MMVQESKFKNVSYIWTKAMEKSTHYFTIKCVDKDIWMKTESSTSSDGKLWHQAECNHGLIWLQLQQIFRDKEKQNLKSRHWFNPEIPKIQIIVISANLCSVNKGVTVFCLALP